MIKIITRRTNDLSYFTNDQALELEGIRDGAPGWWLRGDGDLENPQVLKDVLQTSQRSHIYGYDIIVAAPRTSSLLIAVDEEQAPGVIAAHRESVRAAFSYFEERALVTRVRRGGDDYDVAATWQSVASFTHGINRHGEPHLHDHLIVGARPNGTYLVLDSMALRAHSIAADAVYRASLRFEIAERTTWQPWRSYQGIEHVCGLDEGFRELWGGRHQDRGEKLQPTRNEIVTKWSNDLERLQRLGNVIAPPRRTVLNEHAFQSAFEGMHGVTRRDVVAAWANAAESGQSYNSLRRAVEHFYGAGDERGIREEVQSVAEVRMIAEVSRRGARPLEMEQMERWHQRDRSRSVAEVGLSR